MKRFVMPVITALVGAGLVLFAFLRSAQLSILNPQGPIGLAEKNVILIAALLPAIVVIPVFAFLFYFAWKYRADGPNAHLKHQPNWDHDNWLAEALWWLVPTIIIVVLGVVAWQSAHQLDPYKPLASSNPTLTVEVVALDWKWLFIYPQQGIATVNMLEFPANTPVHFELTADAPMNSFWIPSLGGQIMVMPGMQTQLNLMAFRSGTFNGSSANISGNGFAGMSFPAKAVSQADFDAWVQSVKQGSIPGSAGPLTIPAYQALAKPSEYVPVTYYSSVDSELYTGVIMNAMTPGTLKAGNSAATSTSAAPASGDMQDMPGMQMQNSGGSMQMNGSQDLLMRSSNGTS